MAASTYIFIWHIDVIELRNYSTRSGNSIASIIEKFEVMELKNYSRNFDIEELRFLYKYNCNNI